MHPRLIGDILRELEMEALTEPGIRIQSIGYMTRILVRDFRFRYPQKSNHFAGPRNLRRSLF